MITGRVQKKGLTEALTGTAVAFVKTFFLTIFYVKKDKSFVTSIG